jgi:protein-S-isoprenylcysteine O-methyltransferase Ste14
MELLGKPTISPPVFYAGKFSVVAIFSSPFVSILLPGLISWRVPGPVYAGAWVVFAASSALIVIASLEMGKSLRVGLPGGKTGLVTGGLFSASRNPIYTAFYPCCLAVGILAPHPLVWVLSVFALIVHHRIILSEERFLAKRFSRQWVRYSSKVRRYV